MTLAVARVQVGVWQVLCLGRTAEEAWEPLKGLPATDHFRDASCGPSLLPLTIQDVIQVCEARRMALELRASPVGGGVGLLG